MPTPFEESNEKYKRSPWVNAPTGGSVPSAAVRRALAPIREMLGQPAPQVQTPGYNARGPQAQGPATAGAPGPVQQEVQRTAEGMKTFGRGVVSDVNRMTGPARGLINDLATGARIMGGQVVDAGREVGGILQRWNRGPHGPTSVNILDPSRKPGAQAAPTTGPMQRGPSRITDPELASRTPSDQGEPVGTPVAGHTATGATKPPQVAQGGGGGPSRYLQMYAAGPDAQNKFIKDANLIHMIRGTNQSWARPESTQQEFGTALEAAAGVSHKDAMLEKVLKNDLEKERLKSMTGRFQMEKVTNQMTGQEEVVVLDTSTGQIADDPGALAAQDAITHMQGLSPQEQQEYYKKLPDRQRKIIDELLGLNKPEE